MANVQTLKAGDEGPWVNSLQQYLNSKGESLKVDGDFGDKTRSAVLRVQSANQIKADGIAGPVTWGVLGLKSDTSTGTAASEKSDDEARAKLSAVRTAYIKDNFPRLHALAQCKTAEDVEKLLASEYGMNIDLLKAIEKEDEAAFWSAVARG